MELSDCCLAKKVFFSKKTLFNPATLKPLVNRLMICSLPLIYVESFVNSIMLGLRAGLYIMISLWILFQIQKRLRIKLLEYPVLRKRVWELIK